ncbi:hypothetical protein GDO86_018773 [Hymenochirus boettgeri]|uniref:Uncharacterized protein n=1 Tax=Hymenochirus boettgeri TaxID=247094 RepID=A0A8T2IIF2_9PIPI|nr:hypothetical protein GDO86_018773 [Hymenochirus boettgeri]
MVPSLACFDDANLSFLFSSKEGSVKHQVSKIQAQKFAGEGPPKSYGYYMRQLVHISLGVLIIFLSVPVVLNLLSSKQVMNTSFNPLKIVNTYGAFGSPYHYRLDWLMWFAAFQFGPRALDTGENFSTGHQFTTKFSRDF